MTGKKPGPARERWNTRLWQSAWWKARGLSPSEGEKLCNIPSKKEEDEILDRLAAMHQKALEKLMAKESDDSDSEE